MQSEIKQIIRSICSKIKAFKPTKDEFVRYFIKKLGSTRGNALTLYDELEERGWMNKNGNCINNWKAYANKVVAERL